MAASIRYRNIGSRISSVFEPKCVENFSVSNASVVSEFAGIRTPVRLSVRPSARPVRHLFFEKDPSTNGDGLSKKVFRERTMGAEHGGGGRIEENRERRGAKNARKEG